MSEIFDSGVVVYIVVALVPNLFVMLLAMARMNRDIRLVTAKLSLVESDNRILDEGLKALAHEVTVLRQQPESRGPAPANQARSL